jgi:hypothetical protein
MTVWIKTNGTPMHKTAQGIGATVGMDIYGNYGDTWARIGGMNTQADVAIKGDRTTYGWQDTTTSFVDWGQDWTKITYDFIMPNLWYGDGGYMPMGGHQVPSGTWCTPLWICPWVGQGVNGNPAGNTAWFSDFQLYINP